MYGQVNIYLGQLNILFCENTSLIDKCNCVVEIYLHFVKYLTA